jgi:hypothetical protein
MVGNESLEISEDQLVLVPVITANYVADPSQTSEWLYGMVRSDISGGDNPPQKVQLRINGNPLDDLDPDKDDLEKYEIETPIFTILIPESPAGRSLKDRIEMPMHSSGFFPSVTRGYFVMLKLNADKEYFIESYATGATTAYGQYHTSLLYHIFVKQSIKQKQLNIPPSRLGRNILAKIYEKNNKGELIPDELDDLNDYVGSSIDKVEKAMLGSLRKKENEST